MLRYYIITEYKISINKTDIIKTQTVDNSIDTISH